VDMIAGAYSVLNGLILILCSETSWGSMF